MLIRLLGLRSFETTALCLACMLREILIASGHLHTYKHILVNIIVWDSCSLQNFLVSLFYFSNAHTYVLIFMYLYVYICVCFCFACPLHWSYRSNCIYLFVVVEKVIYIFSHVFYCVYCICCFACCFPSKLF